MSPNEETPDDFLSPFVVSTQWDDSHGNKRSHQFIHMFCGMDTVKNLRLVSGSKVMIEVGISKTLLDIQGIFNHPLFNSYYNGDHPKVIALKKAVDTLIKTGDDAWKTVEIKLPGGGWNWTPVEVSGHPEMMFFLLPGDKVGKQRVPSKTCVLMLDLYQPSSATSFSKRIKATTTDNFIVG